MRYSTRAATSPALRLADTPSSTVRLRFRNRGVPKSSECFSSELGDQGVKTTTFGATSFDRGRPWTP
eukprot:scaffold81287_cov72-Phaeocystis_antarctica.AAC.2